MTNGGYIWSQLANGQKFQPLAWRDSSWREWRVDWVDADDDEEDLAIMGTLSMNGGQMAEVTVTPGFDGNYVKLKDECGNSLDGYDEDICWDTVAEKLRAWLDAEKTD